MVGENTRKLGRFLGDMSKEQDSIKRNIIFCLTYISPPKELKPNRFPLSSLLAILYLNTVYLKAK